MGISTQQKFKLLKIISDNKDTLIYFSSPDDRTSVSLYEHTSTSPEDINFITAGELNKFFARNSNVNKYIPVLRYADSEEVLNAILDLYELRVYTDIMNNNDANQLVEEGCVADVTKLLDEIADTRTKNHIKSIVASAIVKNELDKNLDVTTLIQWQRILPEYPIVGTDVQRYL